MDRIDSLLLLLLLKPKTQLFIGAKRLPVQKDFRVCRLARYMAGTSGSLFNSAGSIYHRVCVVPPSSTGG